MGGTLLVGGQDMGDLVFIVVKLIVEVEDGAAGITEDGVDMLFEQAFHQDLGAGHLH